MGFGSLFGRLWGLLGGLLALFYLTLLCDASSCVYFLCFVAALGGFFILFYVKNH